LIFKLVDSSSGYISPIYKFHENPPIFYRVVTTVLVESPC